MKLAILLTCHNRISKTDKCLDTLMKGLDTDKNCLYQIYLVDDGSSDGTTELIINKYPIVNLINGTGSLFWAGGMRLAWETALNSKKEYDGFLLINDDVEFTDTFWDKILITQQWCQTSYNKDGIYVLSVKDKQTKELTYGGHKLQKRFFKHQIMPVYPSVNIPILCQLTNANILYVSASVVDKIGIIDSSFEHLAGDFDYSLRAIEKKIPVLVCPGYGGYCSNDHVEISLSSISLKKRIEYLYSIKGFALKDYLLYLKKHFWWKVPYAFIVMWCKTLFPRLIR